MVSKVIHVPPSIAPDNIYRLPTIYAAGISRTRLHELKKKHGIELPKFYFGKHPWVRGSDIIRFIETVAAIDETATT